MQSVTTDTSLTSSEAADLLGVHPSTIKRWCNEGELGFTTTTGGHRRISLDDAVALARSKDMPNVLSPFHPYEPHVWSVLRQVRDERSFERLHALAMGWVMRGQLRRLSLLFDAVARHTDLSLPRFCDGALSAFMAAVGEAWAQGRLRVGDEHLTSQAMTEVLLKLRADRRDAPEGRVPTGPAPVAVVGALEGNEHQMGSLCVRLVLEAAGWDVFYLGADVPTEDFAVIQRGREATLVCISLPYGTPAGTVAKALRSLSARYDAASPYTLVLGGSDVAELPKGLVDGPFGDARIFSSCGELSAALEAGFAKPTAAAG